MAIPAPRLRLDYRWLTRISTINAQWERNVPEFRCNMLDDDGEILFPADIVAETLSIAVQYAFDNIRRFNAVAVAVAVAKRAYAFEVWTDEGTVFHWESEQPVG
jgi:hypothetical protein